MIERFLFDRVNAESGTSTVSIEHHPAVTIGADKAKTAVPGFQSTGTRAQLAQDASVRFFSPPAPQRVPSRTEFDNRQIGRVHITEFISFEAIEWKASKAGFSITVTAIDLVSDDATHPTRDERPPI